MDHYTPHYMHSPIHSTEPHYVIAPHTPPTIYQLPQSSHVPPLPRQNDGTHISSDYQHEQNMTDSTINGSSTSSYLLDSGAIPTHLRHPQPTMTPHTNPSITANGDHALTTHQGPATIRVNNDTIFNIPQAVCLPNAPHNLLSVGQLTSNHDVVFQKQAAYITRPQPPPPPGITQAKATRRNGLYFLTTIRGIKRKRDHSHTTKRPPTTHVISQCHGIRTLRPPDSSGKPPTQPRNTPQSPYTTPPCPNHSALQHAIPHALKTAFPISRLVIFVNLPASVYPLHKEPSSTPIPHHAEQIRNNRPPRYR